jgi:phosphohistidine phosphatase
MRLYFLRHGEAGSREEWTGPDEERPLTKGGKAEMRDVARGMRWLGLGVELVLSSPLVRAEQTAAIAADALGQTVTLAPGLASGCTLVALAETLAAHLPAPSAPDAADTATHEESAAPVFPRGVLLVGHEPDFSTLIGTLIGRKGNAAIALKKGALCRVDLDPTAPGWRWDTAHLRASGTLAWLLTAKQMARLGQ